MCIRDRVYWEFLEALAALASFVYKNPYQPLETKIDDFIVNYLQASPVIDKKRAVYNLYFKSKQRRAMAQAAQQ